MLFISDVREGYAGKTAAEMFSSGRCEREAGAREPVGTERGSKLSKEFIKH